MKVHLEVIPPDRPEEARLSLWQETETRYRLSALLEEEGYRREALLCRRGEERCPVPLHHIQLIQVEGGETVVYAGDGRYLCPLRLYEAEEQLDSRFVRISRFALVNLTQVLCYRPLLNGLMEITLRCGQKSYISRRYLKDVREQQRRFCHETT